MRDILFKRINNVPPVLELEKTTYIIYGTRKHAYARKNNWKVLAEINDGQSLESNSVYLKVRGWQDRGYIVKVAKRVTVEEELPTVITPEGNVVPVFIIGTITIDGEERKLGHWCPNLVEAYVLEENTYGKSTYKMGESIEVPKEIVEEHLTCPTNE